LFHLGLFWLFRWKAWCELCDYNFCWYVLFRILYLTDNLVSFAFSGHFRSTMLIWFFPTGLAPFHYSHNGNNKSFTSKWQEERKGQEIEVGKRRYYQKPAANARPRASSAA
jgi:hypothetical protein